MLILFNQMDGPRCTVDTQKKRCDVISELLFAYLRLFWSLFLFFDPLLSSLLSRPSLNFLLIDKYINNVIFFSLIGLISFLPHYLGIPSTLYAVFVIVWLTPPKKMTSFMDILQSLERMSNCPYKRFCNIGYLQK